MSGFYSQSTPFEQNSNAGQGQQQSGSAAYGGYGGQQQPNQQQQAAAASGYGGYSAGGWAGTSGGGQQQQQQQTAGGYQGQSQQSQSSWNNQSGWQAQSVPSTSGVGAPGGNIPTAPAAPGPAAAPQQQQAQPSSIFNPAATVMAAAVSGNNDAMMKAATDVGQQFLAQGTARLVPGLDLFMRTLRVYFAVDNRYVKTKIGRVLFPFTKRNWARMVREMQIRYGFEGFVCHWSVAINSLCINAMGCVPLLLFTHVPLNLFFQSMHGSKLTRCLVKH